MRQWRRYWLTLTCSLWLIVAGGAAAFACMSHPTAQAGAPPLLCLDLNAPATLNDRGPVLLADGRKLRLPHPFLTPVMHLATISTRLPVVCYRLTYRSRRTQEDFLPSALASFPPVLRL